jgi:transposase InsO family protein
MENEFTHSRQVGKASTKHKASKRYDVAFREKIVRMHVDDKIPIALLHTETGVALVTIREWVSRYNDSGPQGLVPLSPPGRAAILPRAVSDKIIEIKKENPSFGVRRIGDVLGRWFGLPGSREKVRTVLKDEGLSTPPKTVRQHNPSKPRFFERSTPNQLWQTDIMSFRMGGKQVYLIGFIDDYSRYIVGLGLYASQTTEHVLETYRKACAEYGVPKEMLTDNGRQYTNWRGKTRFEAELAKDKVKHIKSQPHHPQTLGKIERFWKTILEEYLARAQFDSFENARERVAMWVKHYNHKRPHQGIKGVCPADRFYEVASEVRKVIERQIEENVLELALRGKPREPFYLVGRMEGQSVVLQAEKGKLRLSMGDDKNNEMKEREFEIGGDDGRAEKEGAQASEAQRGTEGASRACRVDGTPQTTRDLPRIGHRLDYIGSMAEACDGRHVAGARTQSDYREGVAFESTSTDPSFTQAEAFDNGKITQHSTSGYEGSSGGINDVHGQESAATHVSDLAGRGGTHERNGWSSGTGDLAGSLLQVGEACDGIDGGVPCGQAERASTIAHGSGEGESCEGTCGDEGGSRPCDPSAGHQEDSRGVEARGGLASHIWTGR